jgi:hypothetical protein
MHHSQHPALATMGGFGVKRKAHGAWGLGGPPRPASPTTNNQQPARVTTSSARAWHYPSGRILVVLRELALAREREGRKRPLPYLLPRLLSPLVGSTPQNFRGLRRWGLLCVAFSTIRFAPSLVRLARIRQVLNAYVVMICPSGSFLAPSDSPLPCRTLVTSHSVTCLWRK